MFYSAFHDKQRAIGMGCEKNNYKKCVFFSQKNLQIKKNALPLHSQSGNAESNNASLAQLVEHDTLNVGVQGSSP